MSTARLPDFFLVGAPKCGTTALYRYLNQHPCIYMSPIKEPHFFADEVRVSNFGPAMKAKAMARAADLRAYLDGPVCEPFSGGPVEGWADYLKLFRQAGPEQCAGEASTCYLWSPSAPGNVAQRVPEARILAVLRNPIDRAFSQYAHMLSHAERPISFREFLDRALESRSVEFSEIHPFLNFGLYADQLTRWLQCFSPERIHIGLYEDFTIDPVAFLRRIFHFLGVDGSFAPDFSQRHMEARVPRSWTVNRMLRDSSLRRLAARLLPRKARTGIRTLVFRPRHGMQMEAADRERLAHFYRDDVERLSRLLSRDFNGWLQPVSDRKSAAGTSQG